MIGRTLLSIDPQIISNNPKDVDVHEQTLDMHYLRLSRKDREV